MEPSVYLGGLDIDTADDKEDDRRVDRMIWTIVRENREKKG